jgi:hypothetical protein
MRVEVAAVVACAPFAAMNALVETDRDPSITFIFDESSRYKRILDDPFILIPISDIADKRIRFANIPERPETRQDRLHFGTLGKCQQQNDLVINLAFCLDEAFNTPFKFYPDTIKNLEWSVLKETRRVKVHRPWLHARVFSDRARSFEPPIVKASTSIWISAATPSTKIESGRSPFAPLRGLICWLKVAIFVSLDLEELRIFVFRRNLHNFSGCHIEKQTSPLLDFFDLTNEFFCFTSPAPNKLGDVLFTEEYNSRVKEKSVCFLDGVFVSVFLA